MNPQQNGLPPRNELNLIDNPLQNLEVSDGGVEQHIIDNDGYYRCFLRIRDEQGGQDRTCHYRAINSAELTRHQQDEHNTARL